MSIDATRWAWMQQGLSIAEKIVLLAIADRADEAHSCYPGVACLAQDTGANRKTIMRAISVLEVGGLLRVSRVNGAGNRYHLVGVESRTTSTKSGTGTNLGTSPKSGTAPVPKTGPLPVPNLGHEPTIEPTKNRSPSKRPSKQTFEQVESKDGFDRFWAAYPRKVGKAEAQRTWKTAKLEPLAALIVADVIRRRIDDRKWADPQFIPHPRTYLHNRRWEDEIETAQAQQPTAPRRMLRDAL